MFALSARTRLRWRSPRPSTTKPVTRPCPAQRSSGINGGLLVHQAGLLSRPKPAARLPKQNLNTSSPGSPTSPTKQVPRAFLVAFKLRLDSRVPVNSRLAGSISPGPAPDCPQLQRWKPVVTPPQRSSYTLPPPVPPQNPSPLGKTARARPAVKRLLPWSTAKADSGLEAPTPFLSRTPLTINDSHRAPHEEPNSLCRDGQRREPRSRRGRPRPLPRQQIVTSPNNGSACHRPPFNRPDE